MTYMLSGLSECTRGMRSCKWNFSVRGNVHFKFLQLLLRALQTRGIVPVPINDTCVRSSASNPPSPPVPALARTQRVGKHIPTGVSSLFPCGPGCRVAMASEVVLVAFRGAKRFSFVWVLYTKATFEEVSQDHAASSATPPGIYSLSAVRT